jgi:hypothetical protein
VSYTVGRTSTVAMKLNVKQTRESLGLGITVDFYRRHHPSAAAQPKPEPALG